MARSKWSFWRRFWSLLERGSRTAEASLALSRRGLSAARKRPPLMVETLEERVVLSPAVLTTDKSDYSPGATAQLIGSGFDPNEAVTLAVIHTDTQAPAAGANNPWTVTTAADGSFTTTWYVNPADSIGASFTVTGAGADGDSASAMFTDSGIAVTGLTVSPNSIPVSGTATVTGGFTESGSTMVGPHTATINYGDGTTDTINLAGNTVGATPVAAYTFNSSSTLTADSSGNGKTLTLTNGPTFTASGYQGGAMQVVGANNQFATAPVNITPSVTPQVTFGGWFNASSAVVSSGVLRGLISQDGGGFDRTLDVDTRGGSGLRWSAFTGSGVLGGPTVIANTWTFVAVSYNQTTGSIILDVEPLGQGNSTFGATGTEGNNGTSNTTIGRNPNFDTPFDGLIDNVFFYNQR